MSAAQPEAPADPLDSLAALRNMLQAEVDRLIAAKSEAPTPAPSAEPGDAPLGAIVNGRAFADRLEATGFECEAGSLSLCSDWHEFRRCFEHLAEWAVHAAPTVAAPAAGEPTLPSAPRLIGWRTDDYLNETADRSQAENWSQHHRMLPIFEGDAHTKIATPTQEPDTLRRAKECIELSTEYRQGNPAYEHTAALLIAAIDAARATRGADKGEGS